MDVSSCLPGSPHIYISQPHFYGSPPQVRRALNNVSEPNQNDQTFLKIEPTTGAVIEVKQRSQINLGFITGKLEFVFKL